MTVRKPQPSRRQRRPSRAIEKRQPSRLTSRQLGALPPPPPPPRRPPPKRSSGVAVSVLALVGGMGLMAGGAWFSVQSMLHPQSIVWIARWLPGWAKIATDNPSAPQTLDEIRQMLSQQGMAAGDTVFLSSENQAKAELLLPVYQQRPNCDDGCRPLSQLRVYQSASEEFTPSGDRAYYYLVNQVEVSGPAESFVISALANLSSASGSNRPLDLTAVKRFDSKAPDTGLWFNLQGNRMEGDSQMAYGQLFHYNRDRSHLSLMLQWASPGGQSPEWQETTGGKMSELTIDRSIGLEPYFEVYQVQSRNFVLNPVQLQEITLSEPAFDSRTYKNAMLLARKGLWSPALEVMAVLKRESGSNWTPVAQAQMDLIALHARITQNQAKAAWASPHQAVLAALIDGQWRTALDLFENNPDQRVEISELLKTDTGRIWQRIDAAVRVSADIDAIAWGALLQAAQGDRKQAMKWIDEQVNASSETGQWISGLVAKFYGEPEPQISPSSDPLAVTGEPSAETIDDLN
ncbi:MAG: hypothetical protein WBB29_10220 [Geitlerinemataceae cyanobacterium]